MGPVCIVGSIDDYPFIVPHIFAVLKHLCSMLHSKGPSPLTIPSLALPTLIHHLLCDVLGGARCTRVWSQLHTKLVHAATIVAAPIKSLVS